MAAIKKNRQLIPAMDAARDQIASGLSPWRVLDAIRSSKNGSMLLGAMGISPEEANKYVEDAHNKETAEAAKASKGGVGSNAIASEQELDQTKLAIAGLPDADQKTFVIPENATKGQLQHITDQVRTLKEKNVDRNLRAGNTDQIKETVDNIFRGDLSNIQTMVKYSRENPAILATYNNALMAEATKRGLDPTRFNLGAQEAKAKMYQDYAGGVKTKAGNQIVSFGSFLDHVADAYDANEAWLRSSSPLLNKPISEIAKNFADDQNYQRFKASLIAPAKEYINFLNNNRAEHESDIQGMEGIINGTATPRTIMTAIKTLAKTADARAANLGTSYVQTVGSTYPIVSPQGGAILERLLGKGNSQAVARSQPIPRGWQGDQPTPLTDKNLQQRIFAAAGNDIPTAIRLAKENGWNPETR